MARPRTKPTAEDRRLVKSLAAYGVPQDQIASRIGIRSAKTLRKYFREELDRGIVDANASVAQTLYKMATSGNEPAATLFWLKCRAGWKERASADLATIAPSPFIVAKEPGGSPS
jgi:hypothetical protein